MWEIYNLQDIYENASAHSKEFILQVFTSSHKISTIICTADFP